jgi:hypothetical protein
MKKAIHHIIDGDGPPYKWKAHTMVPKDIMYNPEPSSRKIILKKT